MNYSGLNKVEGEYVEQLYRLTRGKLLAFSEKAIMSALYYDFYVLWTMHLCTTLGNDQLDTQLLYFTIRLL